MPAQLVRGPAWGDGVATVPLGEDEPLEAYFPDPRLGAASTSSLPQFDAPPDELLRTVRRAVRVEIEMSDPPRGVADAYLRLHLLSHRLVKPNEICLEGLFAVLPNVCWSNLGPLALAELPAARERARRAGVRFSLEAIDKFPRMADYVVPSGVRIADTRRVRLGAYLAEGTTVMHEGFVNFNAGTLGHAMVEGRISQGVCVGAGTDVGGGASIMGTLSGGGTEVISIGERCLLGANSGLGISLGDDCIVEAGLYLTAGTVVTMPDRSQRKARALSGCSGLLFRRNSTTGVVEALPRSDEWAAGLNAALHAN